LDSQTRSHLQAELYVLAQIRGLTLSQAALRGVRSILKESEEVPPERLEEAEKAMHTLLQAASIASTRRRRAQIRSVDDYEAAEIAERWSRRAQIRADFYEEAEIEWWRSRGVHITSTDVYAGLKSICPLWPFC
jgi:hypothetical protein